jgi:hypothetical protein
VVLRGEDLLSDIKMRGQRPNFQSWLEELLPGLDKVNKPVEQKGRIIIWRSKPSPQEILRFQYVSTLKNKKLMRLWT